jgi:hypothetical protein
VPTIEPLLAVQLIVSGGQSGVDRAALDAARVCGFAIGGWCPRGRWAEDGPISSDYPLRETAGDDPAERTRFNVRDSDATLVLTLGAPDSGTRLTVEIAREMGRPVAVFDLGIAEAKDVRAWVHGTRPKCLNIAGPRESNAPGIYDRARALLQYVLADVALDDGLDEAPGL